MQATAPEKKTTHWQLHQDGDGVAWLTLDKVGTSANSLSSEVMQELDALLIELSSRPPRALILTSAKQGFIAGADIKEFVGLANAQQAYEMIRAGQLILDRLEALNTVTVAAINGFALGGGLEVALACKYRIAADDPSVTLGFPEVQLGVHPGLGGTVRAIELAGPLAAMELMLSGRSLRPKQALAMGLLDRIVPAAELRAEAKKLALNPPAPKRAGLKQRVLNSGVLRSLLAGQMRSQVAKRARPDHYPAPYALIDLWQRHGGKGAQAYEAEARSMGTLLCSPTSRNLVRVFFLQERLKAAGKSAFAPARHVHVVGAGVMGGDIAAWCAARGLTVTLQDRSDDIVAPAIERARKFFEKRYPDAQRREQTMARLKADAAGDGVASADVVIEAIYENLDAKRDVYSRLEPQLKPTAVLATNTSSIVLEDLSRHLEQPSRLIGLHFFNPVARMPLIEVISGDHSNEEWVQRGLAFARQIDKLAIPCRSSPGFLVNRILMPYLSEAIRAADEGISFTLIDRAAEDFGMPMGPIELADVVGLDVVMSVGKVFLQSGAQSPPVLSTRHVNRKFGKKTGEGFYIWTHDKPQKPPVAGQQAPADLQDRLILPLLNEAVRVLRERIVADEDLIDAGAIFGAGFAPFRGGPLHYARSHGVAAIVARLEELSTRYGERFTPDAGWQLLR